jgi:hypothetical protein
MLKDETQNLSFQAQIYTELVTFPDRIKFPDKSNRGKSFALLMLWKRIEQIAGKQYETLMQTLISDGQLDDPKTINTPGNHVLGDSGKLSVMVNVSVPRKEFNVDWLAAELNRKYKVPTATTKALVEEAKKPGNSQVRRISVAEKGTSI